MNLSCVTFSDLQRLYGTVVVVVGVVVDRRQSLFRLVRVDIVEADYTLGRLHSSRTPADSV